MTSKAGWAVFVLVVLVIASGGASHAAAYDCPRVSDDWPRDGSMMICSVVCCWTVPLLPELPAKEKLEKGLDLRWPSPSKPTEKM
jgi:hypothetical protein